MTSEGTARGGLQRAIHARNLLNAETAAREMGGLSLADALALCELLAATDPKRYERAAVRWLQRFIDERLRNLQRSRSQHRRSPSCGTGGAVGIDTLKRSSGVESGVAWAFVRLRHTTRTQETPTFNDRRYGQGFARSSVYFRLPTSWAHFGTERLPRWA
jgi:hypothetical protein